MQTLHNFLFPGDAQSTPKLTLPPLVTNGSSLPRSFHWLPRRSNTPPAFLEPQPQTTMDQQHDSIRHPRPHRLSLSSLSSISTDSSFEDDHYTPPQHDMSTNCANDYLDCPPLIKQQQQQQEQHVPYRTVLPISQINSTLPSPGEVASSRPSRQYQLPQVSSRYDNGLVTGKDHLPHVANAIDHSKSGLRIESLSPRSSIDTINLQQQSHDLSSSVCPDPLSTDTTLSTDSSPSPSSPVPSSLLTFWASPTISTEQQHEFVTKNAHIKRPRNAWIHFRCYFGQSLKAKDPTIRAEEISKRASEYWSRLTSKQKKPWHVMAEQEKLAHQEAFPDYRYRPKRALPKSVVLAYPSTPSTSPPSHPLASSSRYELDQCSKKFRLA